MVPIMIPPNTSPKKCTPKYNREYAMAIINTNANIVKTFLFSKYANVPQNTTAFCAWPLGKPGLCGGQYSLWSCAISGIRSAESGRGLENKNLTISFIAADNRNATPTIVAIRLFTHQNKNGITKI